MTTGRKTVNMCLRRRTCVFFCVYLCLCVCSGAVKSHSHWGGLNHYTLLDRGGGGRHPLSLQEKWYLPDSFSKGHSVTLPCPVSPPTGRFPPPFLPHPAFCNSPPSKPYLPLLVHDEQGCLVFRESKSEASQVPSASAATSAAER